MAVIYDEEYERTEAQKLQQKLWKPVDLQGNL